MKKEQKIYSGWIGFDEPTEDVVYEIWEWQCDICGKRSDYVLVDGKIIYGGYMITRDKSHCKECQKKHWANYTVGGGKEKCPCELEGK